MTRKVLFMAAFGLLYTVGTDWVMVSAVGAAMSGFEPGEPRASPATIQFFDRLTQGLMFPLIPLFAPHGVPWQWFHLLIFGNGILWGVALVAVWRAVSRPPCRRSIGSPAA